LDRHQYSLSAATETDLSPYRPALNDDINRCEHFSPRHFRQVNGCFGRFTDTDLNRALSADHPGAPPMNMASALPMNFSTRGSFMSNFAPPRTNRNGRGASNAFESSAIQDEGAFWQQGSR
jgi:hypothetical protein